MAIATISVNFATPGETYTGTVTDKSINPFAFKEALKIADYVNNYTRKAGDSMTGTLTFNIGSGATAINATNQIINAGTFTAGTGGISSTGVLTITNATASTSKTTGALLVTGGVGVQGAMNVGGDVVAYASSDERLKDNIHAIPNALEKVKKLSGVTFEWNNLSDKTGSDIGVIAQEVEKVLPEIVVTREDGYKAVRYEKLIPLLIEAIKELAK
jgi:hypothetical protein